MQEARNPLQYLKLHGCLEHLHDNDIPLVLSKEQYAQYSQNRQRLFARLRDLASETTILFIGYRLDDAHIRDLIYKLSPGKRPRWFMVTPDAEDYDIAFWGLQNVEVIKCRFSDFMAALDDSVPPLWRSIPFNAGVTDFPVRKFYRTTAMESDSLRTAFERDMTFVHSGMPYEQQDPARFYEGYDTGWGCIIGRLDVRRKVEEDLLLHIVLEVESPTGPLLVMIRGAAGSGKTIVLKRTAFEASVSGELVLWLEEGGALRTEIIRELHDLTGRTIYLFVDQVALQIGKVYQLLRVHPGTKRVV